MAKFLILGAGLGGRICKYVLGEEAVLVGPKKAAEKLRPVIMIHEHLDDVLTTEELKVKIEVDGMEKYSLPELQAKHLNKTVGIYSGKHPSFFWEEEFSPWQLNEDKLPSSDLDGEAQVVELMRRVVHVEGTATKMVRLKFDFLISTVPLPTLLILCGLAYPGEAFQSYRVGLRQTHTDLVQGFTVYYHYAPLEEPLWYRKTTLNGLAIYETSEVSAGEEFDRAKFDVVLDPGKMVDNPLGKSYMKILEALNVFCLGRYACWNSKILLDDVWRKVCQIKKEMRGV